MTSFKKLKQKLSEWLSILSGWKDAGSIVVARIVSTVGAGLLVVAGFDWSPVWNLFTVDTGFTWKQLFAVGGPVLLTGIVFEITRRRNAKF